METNIHSKYTLEINPKIDVEKWTINNRYKSILASPTAEKDPKTITRVVDFGTGRDPGER